MGKISLNEIRSHDNVVRKERWLRDHPGDTIKIAESTGNRWGIWYECHRDGRQIAEANDLGMLITELETNWDTPESR